MPTQKQYNVTLQLIRQIDCKIAVLDYDYTLIDEVKSASKIKNSLNDNAQAKILFVYLDQYIIAKVL